MPSFCFAAWQVLIVPEWNAPDSTKIIFARLCQFKQHQNVGLTMCRQVDQKQKGKPSQLGYHGIMMIQSPNTSSLQKCTSQWKKEDLHQQTLTFGTFFDHPRCSLMASLIQKFLRNPVLCTDFIRLRVGRDGGSLNWFGLNYSCVFLSLCPSIPLSFLCGVRITQWYWVHLLYKREAMMDVLRAHINIHPQRPFMLMGSNFLLIKKFHPLSLFSSSHCVNVFYWMNSLIDAKCR